MIECILATRGISTDVNGSWRPCCRYEQPNRQKEYKMPWMSKNSSLNDLHNSKEMIKLRDSINKDLKLSMGMSNDYKIALNFQSDIIRIGSLIFE